MGGAQRARVVEPADIRERLRALRETDKTFLVEAGAGSGKTSIMAGRAALMIAGGESPGAVVAITFTEAAAAELRLRIESFLRDLARGIAPRDLAAAFQEVVPAATAAGAQTGLLAIDQMTATTIHGFAQRIVRPYPLEAGMDPGAEIADPEVAAMAFDDSVERWMRDLLNDNVESFTGSLFDEAPTAAAEMVRKVATAMRRARGLLAPEAHWDPQTLTRLRELVEAWLKRYPDGGNVPPDVAVRTIGFRALLEMLDAAPADPVARLLGLDLPAELTTKEGAFRAKAANKKDWEAIGKAAGWNKVSIEHQVAAMALAWEDTKSAWAALKEHAAAVAARRLTEEVCQALERYEAWKRSAALLDFDDLLIKARNLLASHDTIRRTLALHYTRILVDEAQDTDPLQMEIIWRICGDPAADDPESWRAFRIRPGALFMVGDPKQAIYRFRGADVHAYLEAKHLLTGGGAGELLSIAVNFRSTCRILARVNEVFEPVLCADGQPGFTPLTVFRTDEGREVQALEVVIGPELLNEKGLPSAEGLRVAEAAALAEFLQRIIGSLDIPDGEGGTRKALPGDVALLAPAGTAFWIYEAALEQAGIPLAPQAGKGFLNRQEVLDLTALARTLADPRDSLALGAFLRGPVAGFTDEEILDALAALPGPGRRRLSLNMDVGSIPPGRFREVMETLTVLVGIARTTTPYQALAAAAEAFAMRAVLAVRHPRSIERSLANLDAFLAISRAWDTKGLKAFSDELRRRREEGVRQAEGRPDQGTNAVSIVTMHSAKGLEWPIVVPINMGTGIKESAVPLAGPEGLLFKVLGAAVAGFEEANKAESEERARERLRLLYVADTRARDLLVLPRYSQEATGLAWCKLCKTRTLDIPSFDLAALEREMPQSAAPRVCPQTEADFAADAAHVAAARRVLTRRTPSRHEAGDEPLIVPEVVASEDEFVVAPAIKGGVTRGRILHKLIEEVLTGEAAEGGLEVRAGVLIAELDAEGVVDPAEAAEAVRRALALPEIAELRPRLIAETDVASLAIGPTSEELTVGIADAVAATPDGSIDVVVDWKSDVAPEAATLALYHRQLADYLRSVRAERGLIVLMTEGRVIEVAPIAA